MPILCPGTTLQGQWNNWYGPSGRDYQYNATLAQNCPAGFALKSINRLVDGEKINILREEATVECGNVTKIECGPVKASCLFNIAEDPCEYRNLANEYPDILKMMKARLLEYNAIAIPPGNLPMDERGKRKYWNYVFTNFGDYVTPEVIST